MYLKRKVYDQLLDWKNDTVHSTLEVNGARQVGKTYIINKFADENFRHKIYINLFDLSGKQFMECYKKATDWFIQPVAFFRDRQGYYHITFMVKIHRQQICQVINFSHFLTSLSLKLSGIYDNLVLIAIL